MLEGLEIVEVNYKIYRNTYRNRLDSEYYSKEFLNNETYLNGSSILKILKDEKIQNIKSFFLNKPFNYLSIADIGLNSLDYSTSSINHEKIPDRATYILKQNDIVISTVRPNRNAVALIMKCKRLVGTSGFTVLRVDKNNINPYFLFAFCKTKFFIKKLIRENTATMYPAVTDFDILNLKIPIFSDTFQKKIEEIVKTAQNNLSTSKTLYKVSETSLLEELNLQDFQPSAEAVNIKSFKESFGSSGRLDAEYYQRKYDEVEELIKKQKFYKLKDLVCIKKSIEPGSDAYRDKGLPFVRVSNLTTQGISPPSIHLAENIVPNVEELKPKKDTILLTKDGTIGIAYKVDKDLDIITSGAILHITVNDKEKINADYLTLIFNSIITKLQSDRDAGGSIIKHWRVSEIENILIPLIDISKQQQISAKIVESFRLQRESERLLELAKVGVERAIEYGEDSGVEFIEGEIKKYDN